MRILIIGGAGFIGSHLVNLLNNNYEHELVVVDNLSSGSRDNISSSLIPENKLIVFNVGKYCFILCPFFLNWHYWIM